MSRMRFGAFLAPHHPIGENFTHLLQCGTAPLRRSAERVEANKAELMAGAGAAIFAQIQADDRASAAFAVTIANAAAQAGAGSSAAAGAAMSAQRDAAEGADVPQSDS